MLEEMVVGQVTMLIPPDRQLLNYTCKVFDKCQQSIMLNVLRYQLSNRPHNQQRTGAKLSVTNASNYHHRACQLRPFADLTEIVFLHSHFVLVYECHT